MILSTKRPAPKPSDETTHPTGASGYSRGIRIVALTLTVAVSAVAFATIVRPRHGYSSAPTLLAALASGVGVAVGALALVAVVTAAARRRERSVWTAVTAAPTLGTVTALFVIVAAVSQLAPPLRTSNSQPASPRVARGDFQRWQTAVVPIAVSWMHAVRVARAFDHGIPDRGLIALRRRVIQAGRTLDRLGRTLAADAPTLPQRPRLRRLTAELETAVAFARRAQQDYVQALTTGGAVAGARPPSSRVARQRALINAGNAAIRESLSIMTTFSVQANGLGTSLFAVPG